MPRMMSFSMTTDAIRNRTKTVTRRFGWHFLKEGDVLWAVEKAQGLKKGERVNKLCLIQVVSVREEPLNAITQEDCVREGFPHFTPQQFVDMLTEHYHCEPDALVRRIEFRYLDE